MYHCNGDNLNGIWKHIASGMYGEILVHLLIKNMSMILYGIQRTYNSADNGRFRGTDGKVGSFSLDKFIANRQT